MELLANGLELRISSLTSLRAQGPRRVDIEVEIPGFCGGYTACIQSSDFRRFAEELEQLEAGVDKKRTATLATQQRDLCVELTVDDSGAGQGSYRFDISPEEGVFASVTGAFEFDGSVIPLLRHDAAELAGHHSSRVRGLTSA